ncbi:tryptophan synthase subunit alpha [Salisediminibacterium beveridgei]|uniref:Tryptophan synthase alpha chain n=1 Tax=Salisediminibacterium beveridgei TaxID=632773 RepID=A0A1D7QUX8_9BACI|nr:tryptophan synthase subunit alpha [Salisediminibacterium beveridgei]AOM82814.1 Tryptophan synthase alpha chain [Salisediminibacterium beveridgei]
MNRLNNEAFTKATKRFVPYMMSSDPSPEVSVDIALTLQEAGVEALEWGVPFSDPLADGPVIQEAGQRALKRGGSLTKALSTMKDARERGLTLPTVLFTYVNPVLSFGFEKLVQEMGEAGFDGLLIPDLPYEESHSYREYCQKHDLSLIPLVAPSSRSRVEKICKDADGFVYYVTSLGVTGTRQEFSETLKAEIETVKSFSRVPVLAGFGISTPEHVSFFQKIADGAIVGSALVRKIGSLEEDLLDPERKHGALNEIKGFVQELISY